VEDQYPTSPFLLFKSTIEINDVKFHALAKMSEIAAQMVHDKENAGNATAAPTEIMPQKASADTVPATYAHAGGAAPS